MTTNYKNNWFRNPHEAEYANVLHQVLEDGEFRGDRTGTGTFSLFGTSVKYDLAWGFPLMTRKKVHFPSIVHELLWFISGGTNIKYLKDNGVNIWNEWADVNGDLGPVYGAQWRNFGARDMEIYADEDEPNAGEKLGVTKLIGVDQLQNAIERIKTTPDCRRIIVSAWNPVDLPNMALPPCHTFFHFSVREGNNLDLIMYQRSCDLFLGVPFNIASYALLLSMVAQVTGKRPGIFTHMMGDYHIYSNHINQVKEYLSRESFEPPTLILNPDIKNIEDFTYEDIRIEEYQHHGAIKAPVAV